MKDIRKPLYEQYYSAFKKGEPRERFGFLHLRLWYNEKYLPLIKHKPKDAPILDLGCGQGFMLRYLQSAGFTNLTGVDVSAEQVNIAQSRGFNAIHADVFDFLKARENEYEIITAIDIIEHFKKEEIMELLPLIHRALKPGGVFALQTPNGDGLMPNYVIYGDFTHFTILSALSLKNILTLTNFTNIQFKELGPGALIHFPLFLAWQVIRLFAMLIKFAEIGRIQKYWTESIICWCEKPA